MVRPLPLRACFLSPHAEDLHVERPILWDVRTTTRTPADGSVVFDDRAAVDGDEFGIIGVGRPPGAAGDRTLARLAPYVDRPRREPAVRGVPRYEDRAFVQDQRSDPSRGTRWALLARRTDWTARQLPTLEVPQPKGKVPHLFRSDGVVLQLRRSDGIPRDDLRDRCEARPGQGDEQGQARNDHRSGRPS